MFIKSRLAAARLSGITILSTAAGHIAVFIGLFLLEGGSFADLEAPPPLPVLLLAVFLIGVIILLSGWTLARFIYQQDDRCFSREGALHWSLAGLLFGAVAGATTRVIARPPLEFLSSMAILLYLLEMGLVYWSVFFAPGKIRLLVKRWTASETYPANPEER
jgi:hypothetical protein